jgi:hypothetical protein
MLSKTHRLSVLLWVTICGCQATTTDESAVEALEQHQAGPSERLRAQSCGTPLGNPPWPSAASPVAGVASSPRPKVKVEGTSQAAATSVPKELAARYRAYDLELSRRGLVGSVARKGLEEAAELKARMILQGEVSR